MRVSGPPRCTDPPLPHRASDRERARRQPDRISVGDADRNDGSARIAGMGPLLTISLLGAALLAPAAARADIGIDHVRPTIAGAGHTTTVTLYTGNLPLGTSVPISLVPAIHAPGQRPFDIPQGGTPPGSHRRVIGVGSQLARRPPSRPPYVLLGSAIVRADPKGHASASLRFTVPQLKRGAYAFLAFCSGCVAGPRGSLIAGMERERQLLLVPRGDQRPDRAQRATLHRSARVALRGYAERLQKVIDLARRLDRQCRRQHRLHCHQLVERALRHVRARKTSPSMFFSRSSEPSGGAASSLSSPAIRPAVFPSPDGRRFRSRLAASVSHVDGQTTGMDEM
jgi:hypothetical protein